MRAEHTADHHSTEFDQLFTEQAFVLDPDIGFALNSDDDIEVSATAKPPSQLVLPVAASIAVHLCLLILVRQLMVDTNTAVSAPELQAPSIQISFRPRPTPEITESEEATTADPVAEEPIIEQPLSNQELLASDPNQTPPEQQTLAQERTDSADTYTEPPSEAPSQAPRLVAPALLDVRDLIQNRAKDDATSRIYNSVDCDERQRRSDLIDCGEEDPNAQYNFAAAEQNTTVEFFAGLNAPTDDTSNQPRDRTSGDARTRASLEHMNGNLGANPLIRSVMGQP